MTIYDRDYYRRQGPGFLGSANGSVCKWLIIINAVVFVLQVFDRGLEGPLTNALMLSSDDVLHGEIWRLLTYAFLHAPDSLMHIVFNMLFLWWFGNELEEMYGPREFLTFYLTAAILSGIAYVSWQAYEQIAGRAVGASGAVTAVMVLYAVHFPHRQILLFFLFPIPIWIFVGFQVLEDTYTLLISRQPTFTAVACHLGGAAFGFAYHHYSIRLLNVWPDWRLPRLGSRPKLRVYRAEDEPEPVSVAAPPANPRVDEQLEAQLDAILEKVGRSGKESLTEQERAILLRASEIYKRRRN